MLNLSIPCVFSNVANLISFLRICIEHLRQQVLCIFRQELWYFKVAIENFLVQISRIWIFKWQVAADKGVKNYTTAPDVNLRSKVSFACYHLRRSIARTSTCCLESLAILVSVAQTKVYDFNLLIMRQQ